MAGKGGGSWKVAYADFVTAMMAFFLVMWITGQNQEVKEAISNYFEDPFGKPGEASGPMNMLAGGGLAAHQRRGELNKRPGVKAGDSQASGEGLTVIFPGATAELTPLAQTELKKLAPQLAGMPQRIEIRGHASRAPLPEGCPFRDAWDLSYARCLAVMHYLEKQGIDPQRLRLSQGGAYEPATNAEDAQKQLENERVNVFMLREFVPTALGIAPPGSEETEALAAADGHAEHGGSHAGASHGSGHGAAKSSGHGSSSHGSSGGHSAPQKKSSSGSHGSSKKPSSHSSSKKKSSGHGGH